MKVNYHNIVYFVTKGTVGFYINKRYSEKEIAVVKKSIYLLHR
jgi:hypothetical protein